MTGPLEIGFLLVNLLAVVVAVAGAILFGIRLRDQARTLGIVGCLLLILTGLGYVLLQVLPAILPGFDAYEVFGSISLVSGLFQALGVGLIIVAAVTGRRSAPAGYPPAPPTRPAHPGQPHPGSSPGPYGPPPGSDPGPPPRW